MSNESDIRTEFTRESLTTLDNDGNKKVMSSFRSSTISRTSDYEEYVTVEHSSVDYPYDDDDEVFLDPDPNTGLTVMKCRPRRTSDVIDSLSSGSPKSYTNSLDVPKSYRVDSLQSPPTTPSGSDAGYCSTTVTSPKDMVYYRPVWSRGSSSSSLPTTFSYPPSRCVNSNDNQNRTRRSDTIDANPTVVERTEVLRTFTRREVIGRMPVAKDSEIYNMDHPHRGPAIIFNNTKFTDAPPRDGSDKDVERLEKTCKKLGFDLSVHSELGFHEIQKVLDEVSRYDFSDCDCLFVAVLTHGLGLNYLRSKDLPYQVQTLWKPFTADLCPTLAGKPKIFVIQSCRGEEFDPGVRLMSCTQTDSGSPSYKIPSMADFVFAYSTFEGFFSWRNPETGTWFINSLCDTLNDLHETTDFLKMLTITARKVALDYESYNEYYLEQHGMKQTPSITTTLLRDVYFKPKSNASA